MDNKSRALEVIEDYLETCEDPRNVARRSNSKDRSFEQLSYCKWTTRELKMRLLSSEERAYDVMTEFIHEMDSASTSCAGQRVSFVFSVAHDVAEDIFYRWLMSTNQTIDDLKGEL